MKIQNKITPFFWFEKDAKDIIKYYKNIFKDFKIIKRNKFSGSPSGNVEIVEVEMVGFKMIWMITVGPFRFNEAISLTINCKGQKEVDYYWSALTKNGGKEVECGWCKDKYGLCWQVIPEELGEVTTQKDKVKAKYAFGQMMKMKKIIIKDLSKAYEGK